MPGLAFNWKLLELNPVINIKQINKILFLIQNIKGSNTAQINLRKKFSCTAILFEPSQNNRINLPLILLIQRNESDFRSLPLPSLLNPLHSSGLSFAFSGILNPSLCHKKITLKLIN